MRRLWELRASSRFGAGRYAESRADFLVLEQTAPTDAIRAINQNNVAWVSLMSGDALLRADALERSRAALAVNPDQRAFQGTYAFALLETGATEAAAEVLEKVVVDHPRPRDRALTLCLLGMARARLHDTQAALVHIQAAESADPRCALLDRARTEVARPPAAAAAG
jgi:predicted Zn-dependent protease